MSLIRETAGWAFVRQTTLVFVATVLGNGFGYLLQVWAGRQLGQRDYSAFAALLQLITLAGFPAILISTLIARLTARATARNPKATLPFATPVLLVGIGGGSALAAMLLLLAPWLSRYLHLGSDLGAIRWVALAIWLTVLFQYGSGLLQGLGRFSHLCVTMITDAGLRLLGTVGLLALGAGPVAGVGAAALAYAIAAIVALAPLARLFTFHVGSARVSNSDSPHFTLASWNLRSLRRAPLGDSELTLGALGGFAWLALVGQFSLALLTTMDTILARHFLDAGDAGAYSATSLLGRILLFFPAAVGTVMFTHVARAQAHHQPTMAIIRTSALAVLALVGPLAVLFALFPGLMLRIQFGTGYTGAAHLVWRSALLGGLLALVALLIQYYLALRNPRFALVLLAGAAVILGSLQVLHNSAAQMLNVMIVGVALILVVGEGVAGGLLGRVKDEG